MVRNAICSRWCATPKATRSRRASTRSLHAFRAAVQAAILTGDKSEVLSIALMRVKAKSDRVKDRLRNGFNVSVAEIEEHDNPKYIVLGFAMVSNEAHPIKQTLGEIVNALKAHPIAEFVDYEIET